MAPTRMTSLLAATTLAAGCLVGGATAVGAAPAPRLAAAPLALSPVARVVIDASGTLQPNDPTLRVTGAFPSAPTAVSNGSFRTDPMACDTTTSLSFLAVVAGTLGTYTTTYAENGACSSPPPATLTTTRYSAGWSGMRQLVEAPGATGTTTTIYALHENGRLYRYTKNGSTIRGAGSVPGFTTARSMDLVSDDAGSQTLLMNLSGGSLYQVTVPKGGTMTVRTAPVRTRSWQGFEQVLTSPRSGGGTDVLAVDAETGNGYAYTFGVLRGTATTISSAGSQPGAYSGLTVRGGLNIDLQSY